MCRTQMWISLGRSGKECKYTTCAKIRSHITRSPRTSSHSSMQADVGHRLHRKFRGHLWWLMPGRHKQCNVFHEHAHTICIYIYVYMYAIHTSQTSNNVVYTVQCCLCMLDQWLSCIDIGGCVIVGNHRYRCAMGTDIIVEVTRRFQNVSSTY